MGKKKCSTGEQIPPTHPLCFSEHPVPQGATFLVLTVYGLLLQTDTRVLEGRLSLLLLGTLELLAWGWAPGSGLLVD